MSREPEPEPPVMVPSSACASCGHDADEHEPQLGFCTHVACPCMAFLPTGERE